MEEAIMSDITPVSEPVESDFTTDFFDEWIAGAQAARRAVTIYGKPGLYAEYQQLERQIELLEAEAAGGEEMAGSELKSARRRLEELAEEWQESKTVWIVERTDDDGIAAAKSGLTEPIEPVAPERPEVPIAPTPISATAGETQKRAHTVALKAHEDALAQHAARMIEWESAMAEYTAGPRAEYEREHEEYSDEVNLRLIAASVVEVRDSEGNVRQTSVTVDQLRQMSKRLGQPQLLRLLAGITEATYGDTVIQAPFSQSNSEPGQTS